MFDRIVSYIMHVCRIQKQFSFHDSDITTIGKTVVWNNMVPI